jgi:hypothetical protein
MGKFLAEEKRRKWRTGGERGSKKGQSSGERSGGVASS